MNGALDQNSRSTMTARLNSDGMTVIRLEATASLHALNIIEGTTGSDNGGYAAGTDDNDRPTLFAVSSSDGVSPIALYADSSGNLLVKNT